MKKIFLYGTLLFAVWGMVSCQKEDEWGDGDGYVSLSINVPSEVSTRSSGETVSPDAFDPFAVRIYKTDGAKELIRHYHAYKDIPQRLWLKNGNYLVTVTLGDSTVSKPMERVRTKIQDCCFCGEQAFEIKSGQGNNITVTCTPKETVIETYFDPTVDAEFDTYRVCAMIRDTFYVNDTVSGASPYYTYRTNKRVFFLVPNDSTTLSYCFLGDRPSRGKESIHQHSKVTFEPGKKAGYRYLLTFKYSDDAKRGVKFDIKVQKAWDEYDHYYAINPDPSPTIVGDGTVEGVPYVYPGNATAAYTLTSSSKSEIKSVSIKVTGGAATRASGLAATQFSVKVENPTEWAAEGITLDVTNRQAVKLELAPIFFQKYIPGGTSTINITARDLNDQDGIADVQVLSSGVLSLASCSSAADKWAAKGEIKSVLYAQDPQTVEVQYRESGTEEWTSVPVTVSGGTTYTTVVTGITGSHTYEYRMLVDGEQAGTARTVTINGGWQIPNADFEIWSNISEMWLPYENGGEQWWDNGNHGSIKVKVNVTTEVEGKRGSAAYLNSQKATFMGIGKFAAGNIFVGKYLGTVGTNGVIGFGKPFTPEYRPKKVKFWYKGTVGEIDEVDNTHNPPVSKGQPDVAQFYVLLCSNMYGPHVVTTADTKTFMNLESSTIDYCTDAENDRDKNSRNSATDGHIVAKAIWENQTSKSDWTLIEIPLEYTEYGDETPNYILVTASASKYGDYFTGSTASDMYIDEVTFEY